MEGHRPQRALPGRDGFRQFRFVPIAEGGARKGFVAVVHPLDGFQDKGLAVYGIDDIDVVVVGGFDVEDRFAAAAFHKDQLVIFGGEKRIADKIIEPFGHNLDGPGGHPVRFIRVGIVDEFIIISAHIVVVPEGIAGIRFNDIGVGAEAVRVVLGVDNGIVL